MKILLILAGDFHYRATGYLFNRHQVTLLEPNSLSILASMVPAELNAEIDIIDEGVTRPDYRKKIYDVVGISFCTSAAPRAYALCRYWKLKGAFVVLGGPHAGLMPEEAAQHADAVISGPAEKNWPVLLSDFVSGKAKKIYDQEAQEWWPVPSHNRQLYKKGYTPIPSVTASRGCANQCAYCVLPVICKGGTFKRPLGEIADEIRSLNSKYILLLDPSPFCDRAYTESLFELFMELKVGWACQATTDAAFDPALLDLMAKSGCVAVFVGFESFNTGALKQYGKAFSESSRYAEAVSNFHEKGISVTGGFIMGGDSEDRASLLQLPELIKDSRIDLARLAVLTPYPGTKLFAEFERDGRLLHKKWELYDEDHVVFTPRHVSADELQSLYHDAWKKIYTMPNILSNLSKNKTMPKWLYGTILYGMRAFGRKITRKYGQKYDVEAGLEKV